MRVFVAGGTGAGGGQAIPALVREGHAVTALARTPEKGAAITTHGAIPASVSLFDCSRLAAVFTGHDAVVNLATAIPPMIRWMSARAWRRNDQVRIEGSAAIVEAAVAAGVERLVQESVSSRYGNVATRTRQGRLGLRRPAHVANALAAREQCPIPGRDWMGAALSQRP